MRVRSLGMLVIIGSMLFLACDKDSDSDSSQESVEEAYARLVENNYVETILWSDAGIPKYIRGELSATEIIQDPEEDLFRFFEEYATLFRMWRPREELHIWQQGEIGSNYSISMVQLYHGIAVDAAGFHVHFNEKRLITSMSGLYIDGIRLNTEPSINDSAAMVFALAVADTQSEHASATGLPQLSIYYDQYQPVQRPLLSWQMAVICDSMPWKYVIDAHTGAYIRRYPLWYE